jgi:heptosyltransferase-2
VRSVLVGAAGDRAGGDEVLALVRTDARPIDLIGATDLSTLAGVLRHARVLVTNDSGAMHFAAALAVNVTAIFGPTREDETRPLGAGDIAVITGKAWCRPCMLRECPLTHACMRSVAADVVVQDVRRHL